MPPSVLKGTPISASRAIAAGAFSTTISTVARSLSPAPAIMVSSIWLSNVSPGSSTAAMPPCAQAVDPSAKPPLASTVTLKRWARLSAAVSPAAPDPMTRMSLLWGSCAMSSLDVSSAGSRPD